MKQNTLSYNGIQYYISVKIFSPTNINAYDDIKLENFDILMYDNLLKLEFENDLSNSLLIGEIIYKDNSASVIHKFLGISNRYVDVTIKKLKNVDSVSLNSISEEEITFNHVFLINDIEEISKDTQNITYRLKLLSAHWWNFNATLTYSSHAVGTGQDSPINILLYLYKQAGLTFDFNNISTKTKTYFISDTDENLQTAQTYLLKRTFNLDALDSPGLLKVIYDYINNKYVLWALKDHSGDAYINNIYPTYTSEDLIRSVITLPLYNNYIDSLENQDPTTFKILNFQALDQQYQKMFDYAYWSYDYASNKFKKIDIKNSTIVESLPYIKSDILTYDKKYFPIDNMYSRKDYKGPRVFNRQSSQWDENHWPYYDIDELLLTNNIVSINTAGNILRKTGDNTILQVDKSDNSSILGLQGDWINTRVVHTFTPTSYRNIVLLGRININIENVKENIYEKL